MFGRSDADFRAHRNRRKSRLGKCNGELDKHFIPQPSPIAPRRTLGGRMNQLLYQEAAYKRKSVAAKANPKKCLFSEPGHENTRYYSTKDKKTVSYSNEYGFSTVEDHEVTGVYPMGGRNMEPQFTSGVRLPLKDHNFRSTTTTKPIHQLFKNFSTVTDSAKKCLKKQQPLQWNVVQSPVLPQLSGFPNSKTPHAQKSLNIQSPVMPRLSTLPYSIKSAMKINIVPPEEKRKPEEDDIVDLELKGSDFQISTKVQKEPSIVPNFKYPITDEPKEVFPNFRYPICGELNDCGKEQIKLSDYEKGRTNSVIDESKPLDLNLKFPVKVGSNTVDSNFPIKGGSNSGNVVTNFNFPRESKSATDLSNFDSPARLNDSELNLTRPLNLCKPLLYSEKDMSKDTNVKNDKLLMVDEKTKRMNERQRKMSVSEMEFEKICQMRSEGSQSLLTDFCHNGKSDSEDNDFDNKKQAKENIEPKKVTNGGRRSVSSNIMNGNGTRRSISSNFINGNGSRSSINTIENVAQCSKLKLPQCYTTQVDKKLQQISVPNLKESPKFVIRKRKDSCIADDTVGEDSFNNYDTISNNYYDSSTLIVNDQNVDTSLKAVDGIDETLSNIQLDDVAETFSKHDEVKTFLKHDVTENLGGKSCYGVVSKTVVRDQDNKVENVGKTFVVEKNLFEGKFCKEDGASNGNLLDSQRNLNFGPNSKRNLNFESNSERNLNLELNSQRNLNLESNSERKQNFGDTFLIPHTSQKVLLGDKKFCRDNRVSILNASLNNEELNNQSLGVDMLNDSLDNTLRFVQNETLCQEEDEDSEVKNCGKIDVGEGINAKRNLEEELQQEIINDGSNLKQEVIVRMNLNLEMDGMRMGEDVENIGENFVKNMETAEINTSAQNCRNPSSIDDVVLEKGKEHQANFIKNLLERHKLLVAKSENLFQSRKRIMSQIKSLEETLIEQEDEFNELNCEFVALFKEFGEVVSKEKSCEMSFDRENECNASTSNMITNEKVSESVIVPFSVRKTVLDTPKSARRVRRNLVFTQLKSEFSCLKTPLPSTAKKLHESTVNKTILTPQSMSVCIQDQVNQLFDS